MFRFYCADVRGISSGITVRGSVDPWGRRFLVRGGVGRLPNFRECKCVLKSVSFRVSCYEFRILCVDTAGQSRTASSGGHNHSWGKVRAAAASLHLLICIVCWPFLLCQIFPQFRRIRHPCAGSSSQTSQQSKSVAAGSKRARETGCVYGKFR